MKPLNVVLAEIKLLLKGDKRYIIAIQELNDHVHFELPLESIILNEINNISPDNEKYFEMLVNKFDNNQTLKIALDLYMGEYDETRLLRACQAIVSQELFFYDADRRMDFINKALSMILFKNGVEDLIEEIVKLANSIGEQNENSN